ncbi:hypothetical protein [Pseudomonas schmalbachii]|uniref:Uncharacterized protein n=1 Tax=Pseudomonas schmalbachii TaxID=2816993 RepID=A0ABS3TJQ0_9PSED|nr:hypothetical protein [Pseudomonas schmalbachii]MBO3273894.1 hypothetical protein [Pseudomonas schmalbachii]
MLPPFALASTDTFAPAMGGGVHLSGERSQWRRLQPLTLPLELAFWALWHCRHARPPDAAAH